VCGEKLQSRKIENGSWLRNMQAEIVSVVSFVQVHNTFIQQIFLGRDLKMAEILVMLAESMILPNMRYCPFLT